MAEENMQDMESKREKSAAEKKAAQAAKKGAKKAAKSLKNGGKLAKFFANPVGLIILAVILAIIMLIGFLSFFLSMPGKVLGQIFDFLNGFWNNIEQVFIGEAAFLEANQVVEVGQYLEDMGYDLYSYGFGEPYYEEDSNGIVKTEKGGNKIKEGAASGLLDDTENDVLYNYLLSDLKTYALAKLTFSGSEGTGMIDIEEGDFEWYDHITDGVKVDRETKTMIIDRYNPNIDTTGIFEFFSGLFNKDTYVFDIDGWSGRYGKPLELLLTLHLATMTPDISMALATDADFNTKVNIGLKEQTNYIKITYEPDDGSGIKNEKELQEIYLALINTGLKDYMSSQELYDAMIELFLDDVENELGTYEEYLKNGTTANIEKLLSNNEKKYAGTIHYPKNYNETMKEQEDRVFIEDGVNANQIVPGKIARWFGYNKYYGEIEPSVGGVGVDFTSLWDAVNNLNDDIKSAVETTEYPEKAEELIYLDAEDFNNLGIRCIGFVGDHDVYEFKTTWTDSDGKIITGYYPLSSKEDGEKYGFSEPIYSFTDSNYKKGKDNTFQDYAYQPLTFDFTEYNDNKDLNILKDTYIKILKLSYDIRSNQNLIMELVDLVLENETEIRDDLHGLSTQQLRRACIINYGNDYLDKDAKIQNDGKGKEVKTYQPYIVSVENGWFRENITFGDVEDNDSVYTYKTDPDAKPRKYVYKPAEGSNDATLADTAEGDFWIEEYSSGILEQESQPVVGPINENTIKLFAGDDMKVGTDDDPKYYIYDGTKRTAEIIHLLEAKDLLDSSAFSNLYIEKMKDLGIETVEELEKIEKTIKRPISLDRSSLTAFSILENAGTLDSEYILRDLKELLIELKYFTEDDFIEYDTNVLEFIVPNAQIEPDEATGKIQWPDVKVYEDESKTEKPVMEYYTGIRKERFNVGDSVIAPGTGIITDSTDTSVTIKFITPTQIEGMKITIEGFDVDISNATNIIYDGKTEKKIEKGATIGKTSTTMVKMYLYDVDDSIINDIEEYMNPFALTKNDMVVKIDDPRSPKIVTDKETLKSVIEKGWNTSRDKSNLTSDEVLEAMLKAQETYKVNALFLAAITIKESSAGTGWDLIDSSTYNWCSIQGSYNGESYTDRNGTKWKKYPSFAEAITDCAKLIAETGPYFEDGRIWISTIGKKYCPPGTEWSEGVANIMSNFYKNVY